MTRLSSLSRGVSKISPTSVTLIDRPPALIVVWSPT
jgi:hypothetical protein